MALFITAILIVVVVSLWSKALRPDKRNKKSRSYAGSDSGGGYSNGYSSSSGDGGTSSGDGGCGSSGDGGGDDGGD